MSERLTDPQLLKEYSRYLGIIKHPLVPGTGKFGAMLTSMQIMDEIMRRNLLLEAIEIANQNERQSVTSPK